MATHSPIASAHLFNSPAMDSSQQPLSPAVSIGWSAPSSSSSNGSGGGSISSTNSSLSSSNSFAMESLVEDRCTTIDPIDEPKRSYSACALTLPDAELMMGFLGRKPYRPFRSNEEYLVAMKEDLAEWLNTLYSDLDLTADNFLSRLETGALLCRHANSVLRKAREWKLQNGYSPFKHLALSDFDLDRDVPLKKNAPPGTFQARDNVANFIDWCRRIRIHECLLFETEDLVARKNEKSFVLCLLEVARYGAKFGLLAPTLVQFEQEIDKEIEDEQHETCSKNNLQSSAESSDNFVFDDYTPKQQITNNDLESLHEKVVNLLSRCTCPVQFYLEHLSEGKYRIGDTRTLIFVRILRNHVMVRVGGGWDTLEHYLEKHDPCRCRFGHRYSNSARVNYTPNRTNQMQVTYERPENISPPSATRRSVCSVNSSPSASRRLTRPNSVTQNLSSLHDLTNVRRGSTSSNDSASSMSLLPSTSEKCDSLASSEHSSLSSSHSLSNFNSSLTLPDRNNNINGLANKSQSIIPQPKASLNKKRMFSTPDVNSRIPKSKGLNNNNNNNNGNTNQLRPIHSSGSKLLSNAHKVKSTSSLAIPQFGNSASTKIPCLDATNKLMSNHGPASSRYSTNNIYMAVSQETANKKCPRRDAAFNSVIPPPKNQTRFSNLGRAKQKSSLELNMSNENFYSFSQTDKLGQVPKCQGQQKTPFQQHRRHSSSSSLPRGTKSAHSSPYSKRREFSYGINARPTSSPGTTNVVNNNKCSTEQRRYNDDGDGDHDKTITPSTVLESNNLLDGSIVSLNSTTSTSSDDGGGSGSSSSNCSSLNTAVANSREDVRMPTVREKENSSNKLSSHNNHNHHHKGSTPSFLEERKKSFICADKKTPPPSGTLVQVCSWMERNHLTST